MGRGTFSHGRAVESVNRWRALSRMVRLLLLVGLLLAPLAWATSLCNDPDYVRRISDAAALALDNGSSPDYCRARAMAECCLPRRWLGLPGLYANRPVYCE